MSMFFIPDSDKQTATSLYGSPRGMRPCIHVNIF